MTALRRHTEFTYVFFEADYIHIVFPGVSLSRPVFQAPCGGGGDGGLGSSDGKVGQLSRPSAGELLKRPGEMMSWALSPLMLFSPPSYSGGEARQQERSQALVKAVMHIRETHDTDDFIELK